jgi:hypothetical protein
MIDLDGWTWYNAPLRGQTVVIELKLPSSDEPDTDPEVQSLFQSIQAQLPALEKLLEKHRWAHEEPFYRFYHESYKAYGLQDDTLSIMRGLQAVTPNAPLNYMFTSIVKEGTGKEFKLEDNENWLAVVRPILEAFFHALFFLELIVKSGKELKFPPTLLPWDWATVLHLYNKR